jgi:carbonic anhydrase
MTQASWLDSILAANDRFRGRVNPEKLPVQRRPGSVAVVTCMDPRVNLEALGVATFGADGESTSAVRVIRTVGGMVEPRSIVLACFLVGLREIAILTHTDCGASLARAKIDTIIANMQSSLGEVRLAEFRAQVGEPFRERLIEWLKAFTDPREAARREVAALKALPFAPPDLVVHGLVYDVATGGVEVVVNGYADRLTAS